ncbi:MAG: ferredoxin family protein [Anaerolineae bacterium]|nr:ferredoxin family protein [Anaerolineae bacterium]
MTTESYESATADRMIRPEIDPRLCTGCGDCIAVCRPRALALVGGKAVLARPDLCQYEGGCEPICPVGAIQLPFLIVFHEPSSGS